MTRDRFRLGIDVGGTNTDAVLMTGRTVIATAKTATTPDVRSGIAAVVTTIIEKAGVDAGTIDAVMIGTTQFLNAFVQRQGLAPVAVIRIALPKGDGVPPLSGWPDDLAAVVGGHVAMIGGGAHYDGSLYAPIDVDALKAAALAARAKGVRAVAIAATFAPVRPDIEEQARAIVASMIPDALITLSNQVGGLDLIQRENAAVINASLAPLAQGVVRSLEAAMADLGITAPVYFCQNDGTLISSATAAALPILTCAAAATNSVRGAAFLTGLEEAIVADIGGTTTDIGFLMRGFARETTADHYIGGVCTNLRMPDTLSIGLGGGSLVRLAGEGWTVGPQSVGYRLDKEALVFGGGSFTATDIAVRAGQAEIGDAGRVADLPEDIVVKALDAIHAAIEEGIDQIKVNAAPLPLILVGGGHILVSRLPKGCSQMLRPPHAEVANAIGASIASVSGRVDRLFDVDRIGRAAALAEAEAEARAAAIEAGAAPDAVEIIEITELPMTYLRTGAVHIKVRAVGPLAALA